jgi:DNA polymerase-3 subunit epsilon
MAHVRDNILDQPLVFVDIETNGLNFVRGRVIEVAAIRVEHNQIVHEFSSLIDPETELPPFITSLTGITSEDLRDAPPFHQIADDLHEVLQDAIFVAHNVRFDYSFLKQEFKRVGKPFLPKQLCTVKLSRALYPEEKSHKLASLIARHGFSYTNRHRAYDDAAILLQFMRHARTSFTPEQLGQAIAKQLRQPALPKDLSPDLIQNLPETPGVYIFEDEHGGPLYVGKSINIKKRVLNHFGQDHAITKEFALSQTVKHIRTEQTPGELSALLRESALVKELQPLHNRQLRRLSKLLLARQTYNETGHITIALEEANRIDPDEASSILAVYPRRSSAKSSLETLRMTFDLCPKLLGLEKTTGACFQYQLHKCRGACVGKEPSTLYNERLLTAFEHQRIRAWPYKGAILIEERGSGDTTHSIIVDKWCVLGEVTQEQYCEPIVSLMDKQFDLDTYKILQSYLIHNIRQINVRPLNFRDFMQAQAT